MAKPKKAQYKAPEGVAEAITRLRRVDRKVETKKLLDYIQDQYDDATDRIDEFELENKRLGDKLNKLENPVVEDPPTDKVDNTTEDKPTEEVESRNLGEN